METFITLLWRRIIPRKIVLMSLFALSEFRNVPRPDLASYKVVTLSLSIMLSEFKHLPKEDIKQVILYINNFLKNMKEIKITLSAD